MHSTVQQETLSLVHQCVAEPMLATAGMCHSHSRVTTKRLTLGDTNTYLFAELQVPVCWLLRWQHHFHQ
jgi:hypothetical protein